MTTAEKATETVASQPVSVRPAPVPVAAAAASKVAVVLAILLAALGVVAVRDAIVGLGWASGSTWLPAVADAVDGFEAADWLTVAGVAAVLVGLALIVLALKPRRRTAVAVTAQTPMYLTVDGVAALAGAAARDVPGVVDARATSSRRRVVIRCRVTRDDRDAVRGIITDAVTRRLSPLQSPPRVVVRTRTEEIS
ncbi:hypothetical protein FK535_07795 [Mycolicibacterium sp. 018/SC-01/001]|uniref:DUF6286 domain-containing protein n=1 Tax=Mycolicibacterium sp. 018/SC-01/001 TaxID=2592069 RepID=UPI00117D2649|nr:DUF6286 domain-containing protein [Mycolicibacterium sp. 018/SC-01/001]TRW86350.1 hypothetical protein FK535_07795 [Mycolicibacterium sp. 018/SC-01/001]